MVWNEIIFLFFKVWQTWTTWYALGHQVHSKQGYGFDDKQDGGHSMFTFFLLVIHPFPSHLAYAFSYPDQFISCMI